MRGEIGKIQKGYKYILYPNGTVYKKEPDKQHEFCYDITDEQILDYFQETTWRTKAGKMRLDQLLGNGISYIEEHLNLAKKDDTLSGILKASRMTEQVEEAKEMDDCEHRYALLQTYGTHHKFFCQHCLKIEIVDES